MYSTNQQVQLSQFSSLASLTLPPLSSFQHSLLPILLNSNSSLLVSGPAQLSKYPLFTILFSKYFLSHQNKNSSNKVIYLASTDEESQIMKRQIQDAFNLNDLGLRTAVLNIYHQINQKQIKNSNIIFTTIERLDEFTYHACSENITLIFIAKIHQFLQIDNGEKNCEYERKKSNQFETVMMKLKGRTRIVGLCLPVSNFQTISAWLGIDKLVMVKQSDNKDLVIKQTKRRVVISNISQSRVNQNSNIYQSREQFINLQFAQLIKSYSKNNKSIVIYCQSRRGAIQTCSYLLSKIQDQYLTFSDSDLNLRVECAMLIEHEILKKMITLGICFYSNSMNNRDKELVLREIKNKSVKIVCVSMGDFIEGTSISGDVVVLKGGSGWRGLKRGYGSYSEMEIRSLMQNVGITGTDSSGELIQVASKNDKIKTFSYLISGLVSSFQTYLKENVNTMIYLRKVQTLNEIAEYVKNSLYYAQTKDSNKSNEQQVDELVKRQCQSALQQLLKLKLITIINKKNFILPESLSQIFKHGELSCETLRFLQQNILTNTFFEEYTMSNSKLFFIISRLSKAPEFSNFSIHFQSEGKILSSLNLNNQFRVKKINNYQDKVTIMIQNFLNKIEIRQFTLNLELLEIIKIFKRVVSFLCQYFKIFKISQNELKVNFDIIFCLFQLSDNLTKQFWEIKQLNIIKFIPALKQYEKILHRHSIDTLEKLKTSIKNKTLSSICHQPRNKIQNQVQKWIQSNKVDLVAQLKDDYLHIKIGYLLENIRNKSNRKTRSNKVQIVTIYGSNQICVVNYNNLQNQNSLFLNNFKAACFPLKIGVIYHNSLGFNQQFTLNQNGNGVYINKVQCYGRDMYNSLNIEICQSKKQIEFRHQIQVTQQLSYNQKRKRISEQFIASKRQNCQSFQNQYNSNKYCFNNMKNKMRDSVVIEKKKEKRQITSKSQSVFSLNKQLTKIKKL